jgi:xanthine/uracil permease
MLTGLAVALSWRFLGWHAAVYEGLPGIISGLIVLTISLRLKHQVAVSQN